MEEKFLKLQAKLMEGGNLGERIFSQETSEEVQAVLKEDGLEFSLEEINQLKDAIVKAQEQVAAGELSEDDLENVAGGGVFLTGVAIANAGFFVHRESRGRW